MGHLSLANEIMKRESLLNVGALLFPRPSPRQFEAVLVGNLSNLQFE